jgi:hypothetical protein
VDLCKALRLLTGSRLADDVYQIHQQLKIASDTYGESARTIDEWDAECRKAIDYLKNYQSPSPSTSAKLALLQRRLSVLKGQGFEDTSVSACLQQALGAAEDCMEHLKQPRDYLGAFVLRHACSFVVM